MARKKINQKEMFEIITIPSVFETAPTNLDRLTDKLHNGLKIHLEGQNYIVGELAINEGIQPHKELNSSPNDIDYKVLMNSALLVSANKLGNPLVVTTGFPFATFQVNKETALKNLIKDHIVEYDASLFSTAGVKKLVIEVKNGAILPEVSSSALAVRKIFDQTGDFMMVSLGYGTFETVFSSANGEIGIQRTANSSPGIIYAIQELKKELSNLYPSTMISDAFLDEGLQNGYMFFNRKKVDISALKSKVLNNYYDNVISPALRKAFTDREFAKSQGMFLSGGGALFKELVSRFNLEFKDVIDVNVPEDPHYLAAKGYCIHSSKLNGGDKTQSIGIDLGNSSTIICMFKSES